jgi:hypothetical protein
MTEAGLPGPLQAVFQDGLRFLATALAIRARRDRSPAAVSAACSSLRCFLRILQAGLGLPDPDGALARLKAQCEALLDPAQAPGDVLDHALEAARLARDAAARVLVLLPPSHPGPADA